MKSPSIDNTKFGLEVLVDCELQNLVDESKLDYIFSGHISRDNLVSQICFEVLKDYLYANEPTKSLKQWLEEDNRVDEYNSFKRQMKYSNYYKEIWFNEIGSKVDTTGIHSFHKIDMNDMSNRTRGYQLNRFEYTQLKNMRDYKLLDEIIRKRIVKEGKIKKSEAEENFLTNYNEIDMYYSKLKRNDISDIIAIYEIERLYGTEIIYEIASMSVDTGQKNYEDYLKQLPILFSFNISNPTGRFECENRFLIQRHLYVKDIFTPKFSKDGVSQELNKLLNILYCKGIILNETKISEKILELGINKLIEFVCDDYKLFEICKEKKWNAEKIKIARSLYGFLFKDITPPKIRT